MSDTPLKAIMALDPFDELFLIKKIQSYDGSDFECVKCGQDQAHTEKHTPECPVTHLRNILNANPYKIECDRAVLRLKKDMDSTLKHIQSPTDNGV